MRRLCGRVGGGAGLGGPDRVGRASGWREPSGLTHGPRPTSPGPCALAIRGGSARLTLLATPGRVWRMRRSSEAGWCQLSLERDASTAPWAGPRRSAAGAGVQVCGVYTPQVPEHTGGCVREWGASEGEALARC